MADETVTTVTGTVRAEDLGITAMHEHLLIDLKRVSGIPESILDDVELVIAEVAAFKAAGGATIVELTNRNLGRRPEELKVIAEATGLNVVMGCGWYREKYYDAEVFTTPTQQLAEDIVRDIEVGVGPQRIKAGIIGEIGTEGDYLRPAEERSFRAAARAQIVTGLTLSTHASAGRAGLAQLDVLAEEHVDPRRVIIGHCDRRRDLDYYLEIVRRGAWVQFDLLREPTDWELDKRVRLAVDFIAAGHLDRLLISQDVCRKNHLKNFGGGGYDRMLVEFVPKLRAAGISEEQIEILFVHNPRAALTGARVAH
ncbi:hypothetical protein VSH64_20930 [Amycolatopsis rhabdoformis]|uniref:Phosphotriesterase-related protein n=1 Tax=Amycolatopsis rhabdoformis TaxID=1448059 RepID=A0ABZ1ILC0_9PSEU|nr:hypothetical protein [Amycolatopsis rhabdoformis]WSE34517.1 hypothetical protein VSH64_20930 [Amycolatopsis rhabdoformis]